MFFACTTSYTHKHTFTLMDPLSSKTDEGDINKARKACRGHAVRRDVEVSNMEVSNTSHSSPQTFSDLQCVCVFIWSCGVCTVCLWAAVTSKQQSFHMTGPSVDSFATATGQLRNQGLPQPNNPPPPLPPYISLCLSLFPLPAASDRTS